LHGRRAVMKGEWNGQPVYAKLFFGKDAVRYAARDRRGAEALAKAGLATPALLYAGKIACSQGEILVFREVLGAQNTEVVWDTDVEARFAIAKMLVREVARHHKAGLLQTDLYLKNFLLQGDRLWTLDGDGIRHMPFFAARAGCQNLALLLSKFDVLELAAWLQDLLAVYVEERGINPLPLKKLAGLVEKQRHRVIDGYADKKVFRDCTDVMVQKSLRVYGARMRAFLDEFSEIAPDNLDRMITVTGQPRLKSGNTCTVGLAEIAGRNVVVKRYNIKSWLHGIGRLWRRSRASISWANAHRLRMHAIATAAPLALVERRFGPCRLQAYFLADFIDAPDMETWMRDRQVDADTKELAAGKLARLMYKLRLLQIAHGDMKATNIYIDGTEPVLIDLDSMGHYHCRRWFERKHVRDLQRLLRNWADRPHIQRMLVKALQQTYGQDPLLKKAGI
jgi:tRNA A-37 threonylcarbamoyl transferase component Bud32